MGWWVTNLLDTPVLLGSWVFWVITSIVLHELSHGWAAIRAGDRTPIELGHMTWNPLVHMGPMSLLMFALLGFAWGAMPVDPSRFRRRYDDARVSAAGPAMNLAIAVACALIHGLLLATVMRHMPDHMADNLSLFLSVGAGINVFLMLFNLLPLPPLDGSKILADFWPPFDRVIRTEKGAVVSLVIFFILMGPLSRELQPFTMRLASVLLEAGARIFGAAP